MRVFVTGATGFIGEAVVQELLAHGHTVLGLARNDAAADKLAAAGVDAHRGSLEDPASLAAGAAECDGVAHLGFIHDFSRIEENIRTDRLAVEAMSKGMEGSGKPLVVSFGTLSLKPGGVLTETDTPVANAYPRAHTEAVVHEASRRGVRGVVLRLPPSVHGRGDHGFVLFIIGLARQKGVSAYIGDGQNRWPAVHRKDAAKLYRLALEKAQPGSVLHAVDDEGVPFRQLAQTIGDGLGLPVRGVSGDEVAAHFGWMATFAGMDGPASSALTRQTLAWTTSEPGLLTDVRESGYLG